MTGDRKGANPPSRKSIPTRFGELDLEWFSVLNLPEVRAIQIANRDIGMGETYAGGKHFWSTVRWALKKVGVANDTNLPIGNPFAFQDKGEKLAHSLAATFTNYKTIFDDVWFKKHCPTQTQSKNPLRLKKAYQLGK